MLGRDQTCRGHRENRYRQIGVIGFTRMRKILRQSMENVDGLVVQFAYRDADGKLTQRVVSPIRFLAGDRFLGLCLCREEPRQFYLGRCQDMQLKCAADYVMPVPICTLAIDKDLRSQPDVVEDQAEG